MPDLLKLATVSMSLISILFIIALVTKYDYRDRSVFFILGASAAWLTLIINTYKSKQASKRRHTMEELLNLRESDHWRESVRVVKCCWPGYENKVSVGDLEAYKAYIKKQANDFNLTNDREDSCSEGPNIRRGFSSLEFLLNSYESIAVGLICGDLEEELLYRNIRGQFCSFIYKSQEVIRFHREITPRSYEHIVALYANWVLESDSTVESLGPPIDLPLLLTRKREGNNRTFAGLPRKVQESESYKLRMFIKPKPVRSESGIRLQEPNNEASTKIVLPDPLHRELDQLVIKNLASMSSENIPTENAAQFFEEERAKTLSNLIKLELKNCSSTNSG